MARVDPIRMYQEVEVEVEIADVLEALSHEEIVDLMADLGYQVIKTPGPVPANQEAEAAYYAYHQRRPDAAEIQHRVICDLLGRVH